MAIARIGSTNGGNPGPNLGFAPTPGNLLLAAHSSPVVHAAGGPGSGWADVFGSFISLAPGNLGFGLYWRTAQAGDPAQWPGAWGTDFWVAGEFSGVSALGPSSGAAFIKDQAPPATDHYHLAFTPGGAGEVLVIGAGVSGIGTKGLETPDAGYLVLGSHDFGGAGKIVCVVYRIDLVNLGAYDPGWESNVAPNNYGEGSVAFAGAAGVARAFFGQPGGSLW